jgi:predicted adenylyl cyclase CyaB
VKRLNHPEIELKFPLGDLEEIKKKLREAGFSSQGPIFEFNVVFDTPARTLSSNGCLLRLRRDSKVKLTYKEPPAEKSSLSSRFKVKSESELELGDFETMRFILHRLGFTEERIYEKYREHFTRGDGASAELDHLPHLGYYLELEDIPEKIEALAAELDLDPARGLRQNYFQLYKEYCRRTGQAGRDMRFDSQGCGMNN